MNLPLKKLISAAVFTAISSVASAESYTVDSVDGSVKLAITVQSAGVAKIPGPGVALPAGGIVRQHLTLNADHTMTGSIYYFDGISDADLFGLSGTWFRPEGSKVIYYALDGDPTKGADSDGTYGALFAPPPKAKLMELQSFMPILFETKISAINPIFPTIKLKTGIIKLTLSGDEIKSASTDMTITGRAMITYCKVDKTDTCVPTVTKDASFGFSSQTKSTVVRTDI
jgi:hypothetical protein